MWKTIEQFPNFEINESGVVRNARTHYVTTQRMNRKGYLYVQLNDGEKNHCCLVHRLVAETFIPNPENLPIVNHIDECCVHNSVDNLEWISYKGNSNHGTRNERIVRERKIPIIGFLDSGETTLRYPSRYDASRDLGVSEHAIRAAMKNLNKCRGLYWRIASEASPDEEFLLNLEWLHNREKEKEKYSNHVKHTGKVAVSSINNYGYTEFTYDSITKAAKAMGVSSPAISSAIRNKTKCCGLNWIIASESE